MNDTVSGAGGAKGRETVKVRPWVRVGVTSVERLIVSPFTDRGRPDGRIIWIDPSDEDATRLDPAEVFAAGERNHHVSNTGFLRSFKHRLRWNRSTRFSRPSGYVGQGFTYGSSWALLAFLLWPNWITGAGLLTIAALRVALAVTLGAGLLGDETVPRRLWLLPLQDLPSFVSWLGGFTSREILWRDERYRLLNDGKFELVGTRTSNTVAGPRG